MATASLTKLSITRLRPGALEIDFQLVAFLRGDRAVTELVVEHARRRATSVRGLAAKLAALRVASACGAGVAS
jgi:hypothetical protein